MAQHSHSHLPFWFYSQVANRDLRPEAHREPPVANSYNQGESGREAAGRAVLGCNSETVSRQGLVAEGKNWWRDSNSLAVGHSRLAGLQVKKSL